MNKPGKLVVISGPAGSGKGTVIKELFDLNEYKYSVSATTRLPRPGETDGLDYYFISKEEFLNKISNGEMLEYVEYPGNYYGTLRKPVEEMLKKQYNVILEIEVEGALNIKEKFPEAIMIFITPPTYSELEKRLRNRGTETEESISKRLERAKKEIYCIEQYDYLVINETDLQKQAAFNINFIVESELKEQKSGENIINQEKAERFLQNYFNN
ncbi:MAG: guanylate kinase [Oscillospiraceae bacterium]|nr:guanylate kinase [Oscillospiraceae bacterium]